AWMTLHSEDVTTHGFGPEPIQGRRDLVAAYNSFYDAFPDIEVNVREVVGASEKLAVRTHWHGTHRGSFLGVEPTGKQIDIENISIYHFQDGLIRERWSAVDYFGIMTQIGAIPPQV